GMSGDRRESSREMDAKSYATSQVSRRFLYGFYAFSMRPGGGTMADAHAFHFAGYRLDLPNACLWCGAQAVHLTPKAFAVLHALVQHAGQLLTKDALLQAAWPDTAVSEAALTICIGELRKALGETAQAPRFIQTVHRRGYRFVAPVTV